MHKDSKGLLLLQIDTVAKQAQKDREFFESVASAAHSNLPAKRARTVEILKETLPKQAPPPKKRKIDSRPPTNNNNIAEKANESPTK